MALPVTITGIALDVATVGPYKSSAGNYYFFGKDASTATTLQCFKATDPTDSFSSVATATGFSTAIVDIAGVQDGDIIHIAVADGSSAPVRGAKYRTFNMATDAFVISETVVASFYGGTVNVPMVAIAVRSGSNPVIAYNILSPSGSIYYTCRTGTDTWSAPVQVDDDDSDYYYPVMILGDSDEIHFVYSDLNFGFQRALDSGNNLKTSTNTGTTVARWPMEGISYDLNGTTKCIAASQVGAIIYFDAGDTPTLNVVNFGTINGSNLRLLASNGIGYALYSVAAGGGNQNYYFKSTDDGGAHWSSATLICTATNDGTLQRTSRFNKNYSAAGEIILPFIYADNSSTTLKHNHKVVGTTILQGLATFIGGGIFQSSAIGGNFTAPIEDPFRLRFSILNEGGILDAAPWQLYVSKNGGAYHAVTTTSDDAYSLNAGSSPDETQILIPRLTIPA